MTENIFIFTTRILNDNKKNELFYDCEKIKISDKHEMLSFTKTGINEYTKEKLLIKIFKDEEKLKNYININNNIKINEQIDKKLSKTKFNEIDNLKETFITKNKKDIVELPVSLNEIYDKNISFKNRLNINKVKNKKIFGYRTLDFNNPDEVLNTRENFIYSIVSDISDYLKAGNIKSFFENNNVFLILHEKDIDFIPETDYSLSEEEIKDSFINHNPKLKEIDLKHIKVIIFQETVGKIMNILTSGRLITNIETELYDTCIEILNGATLKKMISVYEKVRLKFAFTQNIDKTIFEKEITKLEEKLPKNYRKYRQVISKNNKIKRAKTTDEFDTLYKELISIIDLKLN